MSVRAMHGAGMVKTNQPRRRNDVCINFYLQPAQIDLLDILVDETRGDRPGVRVSRASTAKELLCRALDDQVRKSDVSPPPRARGRG